jgi:hypothetical protein
LTPFFIVVNCSLDINLLVKEKGEEKNVPRARDVSRIEPCPCPPSPNPTHPHPCHRCCGGDGYSLSWFLRYVVAAKAWVTKKRKVTVMCDKNQKKKK